MNNLFRQGIRLTLLFSPLCILEAATPELEARVQKRLNLSRCQVHALDIPSSATVLRKRQLRQQIEIPLKLGKKEETVLLSPYSLRSASFKLLVQNGNGSIVEQASPPTCLWRGSLRGKPDSTVTATILNGCLNATVQDVDGALWTVQPLEEFAPGNVPPVHAIFQREDVLPSSWGCGTEAADPAVLRNILSPAPPNDAEALGLASFAGLFTAEIAVDADVEFYRLNGSSIPATVMDIETVLNAVDAVYARDLGIGYELTAVLVRTAEPDPYSATNPDELLSQLNSHWVAGQPNIARDIVHLMTGKDLDGTTIGIAFRGDVCLGGVASGLSQSRFSQNLQQRISLTAHELGHNWGACHCNQTECLAELPGIPTDCYIMATPLPANPTLRFGQFERQQIFAYVRNHTNCLAFGNVYVSANALEPFYGTERNPFQTVADGVRFVPTGGRVLISGPHRYRENLQISKQTSLEARGGVVTIGN